MVNLSFSLAVTMAKHLQKLSITFNKMLCFLHLASNWASGEDEHVVARAEYDFSAASEEEISLRAGDLINLAPKGDILLLNFTVIVIVGVVLFDILFA